MYKYFSCTVQVNHTHNHSWSSFLRSYCIPLILTPSHPHTPSPSVALRVHALHHPLQHGPHLSDEWTHYPMQVTLGTLHTLRDERPGHLVQTGQGKHLLWGERYYWHNGIQHSYSVPMQVHVHSPVWFIIVSSHWEQFGYSLINHSNQDN